MKPLCEDMRVQLGRASRILQSIAWSKARFTSTIERVNVAFFERYPRCVPREILAIAIIVSLKAIEGKRVYVCAIGVARSKLKAHVVLC